MSKSAFFAHELTAPKQSVAKAAAVAMHQSSDARAVLDVDSRAQQAAAAYAVRSSYQALNNGWKFPSSRKFLWDRTPMGAAQYIQPAVRAPLRR